MAGRDFGGIIEITGEGAISYRLSVRGTLNVNGAHQSNEVVTNQDGSYDRIITPDVAGAELVFVDDGQNWDAILNADRHDVTMVERKTGATHLYTDAVWTGKPSSNRLNGELSQLGIRGLYSRIG